MKFSFLFFLTFCLIAVFNSVNAQDRELEHKLTLSLFVPEKVSGYDLIENIVLKRRFFNKSQNIADLPTPEYIFNRKQLTAISFNGIDYLIKGTDVVGINGLHLSPEILQQITEKLLFLDNVQYDYAQKCNQFYFNNDGNLINNRNLNRAFFLSLKILNTTLNDISSFAKQANPASVLAIKLAKIPNPNIDLSKQKEVGQSLVQITKK